MARQVFDVCPCSAPIYDANAVLCVDCLIETGRDDYNIDDV